MMFGFDPSKNLSQETSRKPQQGARAFYGGKSAAPTRYLVDKP
jgi:hypothetical protein